MNVDIQKEMEIDISFDELVAGIYQNPETSFNDGINNVHDFLKAIPDKLIADLSKEKKDVIYKALKKQVNRFTQL